MGRWDPVNEAIEAALHGITLADMDSCHSAGVPRTGAAEPHIYGDGACRRGRLPNRSPENAPAYAGIKERNF
jgi:hypothetical protein